MLDPITIRYPISPTRPSLATAQVADLFGLPPNAEPLTIAENVQLDLRPTDLVLFVGPSGSGKSSLMRACCQQLQAQDAGAIALPEVPLVEALPGSIADRLATLTSCGLGEARLMQRTPRELSEGQRYRFRLAYALSQPGAEPLLLDEFAAVLDRTLAKVVAFNLRKQVTRLGRGVFCATAQDDLLEDLNPDVLVQCRGEGQVIVERRDVKKKLSASRTNFGSVPVPEPTGRTSLGGIIAAITSPSSAR